MSTTTTPPPNTLGLNPPPALLSPLETQILSFLKQLVSRFDALEKLLMNLQTASEHDRVSNETMRTQYLLLRSEIEPLRNLADSFLRKQNDGEN